MCEPQVIMGSQTDKLLDELLWNPQPFRWERQKGHCSRLKNSHYALLCCPHSCLARPNTL